MTNGFNGDRDNVAHGLRADGASNLQDWLGGNLDVELGEEVVGLGGYERTLTILTARDMPDPEEIEEEEDLIKSWTPKFRS